MKCRAEEQQRCEQEEHDKEQERCHIELEAKRRRRKAFETGGGAENQIFGRTAKSCTGAEMTRKDCRAEGSGTTLIN